MEVEWRWRGRCSRRRMRCSGVAWEGSAGKVEEEMMWKVVEGIGGYEMF